MALPVEGVRDLIRLLEEQPEWRAEVRRLLLTDDLLSLPQVVRELAEAQARTDEALGALATRVAELAAAQRRTEERLDQLAARVDQLAARVAELAAAQRRTEERLAELAAAQRRTEERLEQLAERVGELAAAQARTEAAVGRLKGDSLEAKYREKAPALFQRLLRRIRVVAREELEALADDGEDRGLLSPKEHEGLVAADVVVRGQWRDGRAETYLVAEVSSVVDRHDVERAVERAGWLGRVTSARVIAAVAGEQITEGADREARRLGAWRVLNGRSLSPDAPSVEWE